MSSTLFLCIQQIVFVFYFIAESYQDQSHQQLYSSTPMSKDGTKRNSFNMSSLSSPTISSYSKYPTNSIPYDPQQYSFCRTKYSPTQDHSSKVSPSRLTSSPPRSYTPSSARQVCGRNQYNFPFWKMHSLWCHFSFSFSFTSKMFLQIKTVG